MPIHEYVCTACGAECEMLQKLSDPPAKRCPHCGKNALQREVSAAGFRLKGSGWYETDFKTSNRHNVVDSAPTGANTTSSEKKSEKKAEPPAKPAATKASTSSAVGA